jgi:hypothetical protein
MGGRWRKAPSRSNGEGFYNVTFGADRDSCGNRGLAGLEDHQLRPIAVKAAKTNTAISTATATVIRARKNLAIQVNVDLAIPFNRSSQPASTAFRAKTHQMSSWSDGQGVIRATLVRSHVRMAIRKHLRVSRESQGLETRKMLGLCFKQCLSMQKSYLCAGSAHGLWRA